MTPRERQRQRPSRLPLAASRLPLTAPQRALLTLLDSAGIEGITVEGLLLAVRSAGYDDLTLDDVRGADGLQALAARRLAQFRSSRWYISREGREALQA
jgi:hypothetical protein